MHRRIRLIVLLVLLMLGVSATSFHIQPAEAVENIYIRVDGIYPPTANIHTEDNVTYTFTDNIYQPIVIQKSSIVLDGNGYALIGTEYMWNGILLDHVNDVIVRNTNITQCLYGIYLDSSYGDTLLGNIVWADRFGIEYGIYLHSSYGNTLSGNNVTANRYGIWLDSSSDNTLLYNNATGNSALGALNGWEGIHAYFSSNNTFQGNNVSENAENGFHLESSSYNRLLENNVTGNDWDGIYLSSSSNNNVSSNNVTGNGQYGIDIYGSSYNRLLENNVTGNDWDGIYLSSSSNNNVSSNNVTGNGRVLQSDGVKLKNSAKNSISGNKITANSHNGIDLDSSPNNTLCANKITENGYQGVLLELSSGNNTVCANNISRQNGVPIGDMVIGVGVYIESPDNAVYENNIAANNYGVYLQSCSSNTIHGNNITTNGAYGAYLWNSPNNMIYGNNITGNTNFGLWLYQSSNDNTIFANNILDNTGCVGLLNSNNNKLYHNNFRGNSPLVSNWVSTRTTWDDGYPSGGNCWSDYEGSDDFSGPDQNLPGSDAIGDRPYPVDSTNQDNYPLKSAHYVVVTNIRCFKTVVEQGYCMNISATVSNYGTYDENVNLTVFADSTLIYQAVTTLNTTQARIILFTWNASLPYDNYTLTACASPVSEWTSLIWHNCTGGCVGVTQIGDINNDGKRNLQDVGPVAKAWGAEYNATDGCYWHSPVRCSNCPHSPNYDVNNDGKIDFKDIAIVAKNSHP